LRNGGGSQVVHTAEFEQENLEEDMILDDIELNSINFKQTDAVRSRAASSHFKNQKQRLASAVGDKQMLNTASTGLFFPG